MPLLEKIEEQGNFLFKHRGILPILIVIPGLCLTYYSHSIAHPGYETLGHQVYKVLCLTITLFGFGIRIMTVGFVPPGTSGRNTEQQIAEKLNTSGMYSVVRHPLYLGNYLMWVG